MPGRFISEKPCKCFTLPLRNKDNVSTGNKLPLGSINSWKLLKDPLGPGQLPRSSLKPSLNHVFNSPRLQRDEFLIMRIKALF